MHTQGLTSQPHSMQQGSTRAHTHASAKPRLSHAPPQPSRAMQALPISHMAMAASFSPAPMSNRQTACRSRPNRATVRASQPDAAGADGIVFGKPQAPRELYEAIAQAAHAGLLQEVSAMDGAAASAGSVTGDVVRAALHLGSEDDAIKTRTHIALPVDSFSARLDNLAAEIRGMMPAGLSPEEQLSYITHHVFKIWGLKVAKNLEDGLYSPYRVYMHQVLAQRCGTQVACAAVLHSLLARLKASGAISWQAQVGLPADLGAQPATAVLGSESSGGGASVVGLRWVTGRELVAELLDQLKRAYWSWDWPLGAASGFEACARGLLGSQGRAGRVNPAVGVMQARGRPFGNVELAMLSSERLCVVTQLMGQDSWLHQLQVRDYATQQLHVGKIQEGLTLLEGYVTWLNAEPSRAGTVVAAAELSRALVLEEKRRLLEGVLAQSDDGSEGNIAQSIIDPDRDA